MDKMLVFIIICALTGLLRIVLHNYKVEDYKIRKEN